MANNSEKKADDELEKIRLWVREHHVKECSIDISPFVVKEEGDDAKDNLEKK